jgi:hypothetical protein
MWGMFREFGLNQGNRCAFGGSFEKFASFWLGEVSAFLLRTHLRFNFLHQLSFLNG